MNRAPRGSHRLNARRIGCKSSFERPAPDLSKIIAAWDEWERGEQAPGKVLTSMKTAGLDEILRELVASGWKPAN